MNLTLVKNYLDNQKTKVVEEYNFENKKIKYSDKLKGWNINKLGDEETVRAYILAKLVNELGYKIENIEKEKEFDQWIENNLSVPKDKTWKRFKENECKPPYNVTLQTFIRNSIHHPENKCNNKYSDEELRQSIIKMLEFIKSNT